MQRDTRANLIFLTLFLLVALPGVFKLTQRAYRTGGRDPAMRLPVRGEWAYMDPTPQVRDLPRVVPPDIGHFVKSYADRVQRMQPGFRSIVTSETSTPVMSNGLTLQMLGLGSDAGKYNVGLLTWNSKYAPLPTLYTITGRRGDQDVAGEMTGYEPVNLPVELRMQLQDYGYIVPPDSLLWMIVTFPGDAPVDTIKVHFKLDATTIDDELKLPRSLINPPSTMPATP